MKNRKYNIITLTTPQEGDTKEEAEGQHRKLANVQKLKGD